MQEAQVGAAQDGQAPQAQDIPEALEPLTVQVGVCQVCDALYLVSGRRETSPCHGADPLMLLATIQVDPGGGVFGAWGPQLGAAPAPQPAAPAEGDLFAEPVAGMPEMVVEPEPEDPWARLGRAIGAYLTIEEPSEELVTSLLADVAPASPAQMSRLLRALERARQILMGLRAVPEEIPEGHGE